MLFIKYLFARAPILLDKEGNPMSTKVKSTELHLDLTVLYTNNDLVKSTTNQVDTNHPSLTLTRRNWI